VAKLALFVLVVGVILSGIFAWSINAQFHNEIADAKSHANNVAGGVAENVEAVLNETRIILSELARRPGVQAMDGRHCDPFLTGLSKTLPQYASFNVLNRQWEVICSAAVSHKGGVAIKTKHPEAFERMVAKDDVVMSQPILGMLTHKWVVFVAQPVKDKANNLLGAVTAPIDLTRLALSVRVQTLRRSSTLKLIDGNGYIVTSYPDTSLIGQHASVNTVNQAVKTDRTYVKTDIDGIERIYASRRVNGSDWTVLIGVPTDVVLGGFRHERNVVLTALSIVMVLLAYFVFLIARQIARPIRELQHDAEILSSGNHAHRSQVVSRDEIGQFATTFNHMAETLQLDEAQRIQAELNIRHLNRVYAVLSQINALIVRAHDRDELFKEACRVVTEAGGFRMSMILTIDRITKKLKCIMSSGKDDKLVSSIKALLSTSEGMEKSMVAQAVNTKQPVISNDIQDDSRLVFGDEYKRAGVNSMIVLPLIISDEAVGALALYASEVEFFQQDEVSLLSELAGDIAFAIDHIDKQERLNFLAYYDELTDLANRSLFLERLTQYMRIADKKGHQLAIGLIDLERFKNINDSLGRSMGDALLKQVAAWLTEQMLDAGLIARIDADHFAILLPEVRSDGNLAKLTEELIAAFLEHPFQLDNTVFRISIKLGIALYPDDGDDADTLFKNAEAALKKAKTSGDRCLFYTQKMTEAVAGKLALENQLREAIDKEEFVLYYQPKMNLASGRLSGAEALIRWNDPRTGLVPPAKFIPILEETGLIYEVGRWALRKAIEDYLRWREAGFEMFRIAVNVSPLQLRKKDFIVQIEQAISIDQTVAAGLELEITENLIMDDIEQSIVTLHAIRAKGIHIAIDDFGTGFSSLSYLARLPLNTLKIDRSFVSDMDTLEGLALVSTIIRVAHALNLKVVAEGVETEEQVLQLSSLNCDEIQGYLYSRPVPADSFEAQFLTRLTTDNNL
jgi:diguanylate cyclase (GGDEF)-like protein